MVNLVLALLLIFPLKLVLNYSPCIFFTLLCRLEREVANLASNPPESRLHVIVLKLHMKEHIMILKF